MAIETALIGYGYWGKILKRYLDNSTEFRLRYVCFSSAREEGIFTNSLQGILKDDSIELVVIATPIKTHFEIVRAAITAKKNVMCEKPLVTNLSQALIIQDIAAAHGVKVITDFTYSFSPSIKKVKEILAQDMIGRVDYIDMRMLQYGRFSGENVFDVLASHCFSILYELSLLNDVHFQFYPVIKNNDIIETGEVTVKKDSFRGKILISLNSPVRQREMNIFGSSGYISFNPLRKETLQVFLYGNRDSDSEACANAYNYEFDEGNNLINMLDYLYQTLASGEKDNLDMALRVAAILELSPSACNTA
jgi:predicted dehydrogenase